MVYLNLSVKDIDAARRFYVDQLELFSDVVGDRISCQHGVELIIDLRETGSDRHRSIFGKDEHVMSSFWISFGYRKEEIQILNSIRVANIEYDEINDLGGHQISVIDPSGNAFSIHAGSGVFK